MSDVLHRISDKAERDYDLLREACGLLDLNSISLVSFTGDDRKGWLQGQATNNLRSLDLGASNSFCLCAPTGQMVAVCDIWAVPGRFLVTCQQENTPALLDRVRQMVILEDVAAQEITAEYQLLSVQGPDATRALSQVLTLPTLDASEGRIGDAEVFCLRSNRTGLGGWDIWVPRSEATAVEAIASLCERVGHEAYNVARLEAGIPLFGADMNDRTLPPEMGPAFEARHVSYKKGCYTGQEVLMRIHSRGHTNRTWMGIFADGPVEPGARVAHTSREDVGIVTSAAYSPAYGEIGAAMVRNEVANNGEPVTIVSERGNVAAELRHMPLLRFE